MQTNALRISTALSLALVLLGAGACNLLTGADDIQVEDGSTESGAGGDDGGAGGSTSSTMSGATCGDGTCGGGETCGTCADDCGACATCGDGTCGPGEDCVSCTGDCGECAATCGSGGCDAGETCVSCPGDCGVCPPMCGNAVCEAGETCESCASDCGACPLQCGDGTCNGGETCQTCAGDCGACGPMCGDGTCDANEACESCASDCGACSTCGGAGDATTTLDAEEVAFVGLLNAYRQQNGLGTVSACVSLNRAAQGHSEDMRDQNYFSHDGLNGSSPWDRACDACYELGCGPQTAMAENIAAGNSGAQATFDQWKNSPGHDANMKGPNFTMIGIGRATGGGMYGVYWTNVFGGATEPSCN